MEAERSIGNIHNVLITLVIEQEEPYEGSLSRTVEPVPFLRDGNAGVKFPCVTRLNDCVFSSFKNNE